MSVIRCLAALLLLGSMGACASAGNSIERLTPAAQSAGAEDALDLLSLVDHVEAAALAASASE